MKPGLWHAALSRLGLLLRSCFDEGYASSLSPASEASAGPTILGRPAPPIPPVFNHCTELLLEADQEAARDLYWTAITTCSENERHDEAQEMLLNAIRHNPHIAEPHVVLAQIHLHRWVGTLTPVGR